MLRKYIYIGIGGFVGAIARFIIKQAGQYEGNFPFDTLLINMLGCFLLALFFSIALEVLEWSADTRLGIATGLLGAFTTFSTVCKEVFTLIWQGLWPAAVLYASCTLVLGFIAAYLGIAAGRGFMRARMKHRTTKAMGRQESTGESEER